MSKFECILNRLKKLEPSRDSIEPWPPKEGSLAALLYKSFTDCGAVIPPKPPGEAVLIFLIKTGAAAAFADED